MGITLPYQDIWPDSGKHIDLSDSWLASSISRNWHDDEVKKDVLEEWHFSKWDYILAYVLVFYRYLK